MASQPQLRSTAIVNVGTGLVGSEVLDQLLSLPQHRKKFAIRAVASSKFVKHFNDDDADADAIRKSDWRDAVKAGAPQALDWPALVAYLTAYASEHPGQRALLIDNTASEDVARLYPALLRHAVGVVTPNKKAFSSDVGLYAAIAAAAEAGGARCYYEATVGAGLPIVSTLRDLVETGDTVTKIEGVFSGTLSYIFNVFSTTSPGGPSFSSTVATAREKGFTEPNPAEDLSGADVARKLTILSRLIPSLADALPRGYESVDTASLSPAALAGVADGDEYVRALARFDDGFDRLRAEAVREGRVLRYVGVVDVRGRVVKASLEKYDVSHPFATSLGGSDNIVMFHTARYGARPLIVQGAGAGAAVTAMGVVSDVLKFLETRP